MARQLACALAHGVAPAKAFHFVNKVDRVRDVVFAPGEALVVDEACFATKDIDDCKALVDVKKTRDVACRNLDGTIPRDTARIFSTNWPWDLFWPAEARSKTHAPAIKRRVLWIHVESDLRRAANTSDDKKVTQRKPHDDEEDPFGFGFQG